MHVLKKTLQKAESIRNWRVCISKTNKVVLTQHYPSTGESLVFQPHKFLNIEESIVTGYVVDPLTNILYLECGERVLRLLWVNVHSTHEFKGDALVDFLRARSVPLLEIV